MSAIGNKLQGAQMRQEWRENSRLRYGVYITIGIVWIYAILSLKDATEIERGTWQNSESRVARARATAASADWLRRSQEVAGAVNEYESLLWREGSIGLSQAAFQERISQSLGAAGIVVRALRVVPASDAPLSNDMNDIVPLRARIQVEFRPSSFYTWLGALAKTMTEKRAALVIESMTIRASNTGQASIADVELAGYALKGGRGVAASPAPTAASGSAK